MMYRRLLYILVGGVLASGLLSCGSHTDGDTLEIFHTTDIHGNFLAYDFIEDQEGSGSLARVSACINTYREAQGKDGVLLLDGGDFLQGQPTAYYYNFVDTVSPHFGSEVLNYMGYDAMTIGNHDIETGHPVYDRFARSLSFPLLGSNVIDAAAGKDIPYFKPYTIVTKGSKKIAIIGTITPDLTQQQPEVLWSGLEFRDQVETTKAYMPEIVAQDPDLIIALIHSGSGTKDSTLFRPMGSDVAYQLALEIPELDLVFCGHDHALNLDSVVNRNGKTVYVLDPGPNGDYLSHVTVRFPKHKGGKMSIKAEMLNTNEYDPDPVFMEQFAAQTKVVKDFVAKKVGHITETLDAKSSFFRPSLFNDLIHALQFSIFDRAQISITAPLAERTVIPAGDIYVRDLFKLYKYENMGYLMSLTGNEIRGHLEESYDRWIHTMHRANDPLIRISEKRRGGIYLPLEHPSFNMDTAAGISYTVDVTKPKGERIHITKIGESMPFDPDRRYFVVMNSYRGNGGGGLLTEGAHLTPDEIKERRVETTDKDLRFFLMQYLKDNDPLHPQIISKWHLSPESLVVDAIHRDSILLFKK